MKINKQEIEHLADLSRLQLSEEEKEKMAKEMGSILDFVNDLQELDVEDEKPFLFEDQINITREDKNGKEKKVEQYLRAAPDRERQFFKVPRIL
jgi:aspartyl-tRNA(Asn)/glutamyl-tRNA(Gln) amidotransferase subunit C